MAGFQRVDFSWRWSGQSSYSCPEIIGDSTAYDCHPHPHNFYIQMLGEAGIVGLITGSVFLGSIVGLAQNQRFVTANVVVATMWIVPFAFLANCLTRFFWAMEQHFHECGGCGTGGRAGWQQRLVTYNQLITAHKRPRYRFLPFCNKIFPFSAIHSWYKATSRCHNLARLT